MSTVHHRHDLTSLASMVLYVLPLYININIITRLEMKEKECSLSARNCQNQKLSYTADAPSSPWLIQEFFSGDNRDRLEGDAEYTLKKQFFFIPSSHCSSQGNPDRYISVCSSPEYSQCIIRSNPSASMSRFPCHGLVNVALRGLGPKCIYTLSERSGKPLVQKPRNMRFAQKTTRCAQTTLGHPRGEACQNSYHAHSPT